MSRNARRLTLSLLIAGNLWLWTGIASTQTNHEQIYFLDVGQGDSTLITLPDANREQSIKVLIDGGRDKTTLAALDRALGRRNDKYLDLVIVTHPDLDHFGGLVEILNRYEVGLFINNGQGETSAAWTALEQTLADRAIPRLAVGAGDLIRYRDVKLAVISPDQNLLTYKDKNETSVVLKLETGEKTALFTGDAGVTAEQYWLARGYPLGAKILKVGHHGSKTSSGEPFIASVRPTASVISVGRNNYGHPAESVLETLDRFGTEIYRTDEAGTIVIDLEADQVHSSGQFWLTIKGILTGEYKNAKPTLTALALNAIEAKVATRELPEIPTALAAIHTTCAANQINVNTAPKSELMRLRHIGEARAEAIIAARPFYSLEELRGRVTGIGESRLDDIINEGLACAAPNQ